MGRKRAVDPDTRYFRYLNRLRTAGRTNMYGAVPYLMSAFGLERTAAFEVVCRWLDALEQPRADPPPRATAVVVHRPRVETPKRATRR